MKNQWYELRARFAADVRQDIMGGDDVDTREFAHRGRMIQRHTVGSTPPTVETGNAETREAEMRHDLDLVQRHATEGIVAVIGEPARFGAVTVAAQVGGHDGEMPRKARCDKMPVHMGQRVAVQEQHGRSAAADHPWIFTWGSLVWISKVRNPSNMCLLLFWYQRSLKPYFFSL